MVLHAYKALLSIGKKKGVKEDEYEDGMTAFNSNNTCIFL
jgi:hypothetical protein